MARWPGYLVLWAGWLLPQFLLLGPALAGWKVCIPLDLLALPNVYLPDTPEYKDVVPQDPGLTDLVFQYPAFRAFMAREFRDGRLPHWNPGNFAGAPFHWPKYSPFEWLYILVPRAETFAWIQLIQMVVNGLGTWLFLRRGLCLSYWPASVIGWCAPLTGFISLWQGYPVTGVVCWLPWLLLAVHNTVGRAWGWSNIAVAGLTALVLLSGQPDVGGLVLFTTGSYLVWLLMSQSVLRVQWRRAATSAAGVAAGWLLGFALAAPYLVPLLEYVRTGARMHTRALGFEERPPAGLKALPAVVLPNFYGTSQRGSLRLLPGNQLESASSAYAGLLAAFWLAPLACCHRRYRSETIFFSLLACVALGWTLDVPILVDVMRLRPLNMFSFNRWTFATSSAVLILAAIGLERLWAGPLGFRRWFMIPIFIAGGFGLCCLLLATNLPEPLRSQLGRKIRLGLAGSLSLHDLNAAQQSFAHCYWIGALLSLAAVVGWMSTTGRSRRAVWCRSAVVSLLSVELLWFAAQERRQADPALYFPRIPALERLRELPAGRIWGINCFPPNLNQSHALEDIRGYDGVDPSRFVKLFGLACDPRVESPPYAVTSGAVPLLRRADNRIKLHPVADLLNVRYLVLRKSPGNDLTVVAHYDDYWVGENPDALPRAFVPRSLGVVQDDAEALQIMANPEFNPRALALIPERVDVPEKMQGTATIRYETPMRVHLDASMDTDGMVVVSDLWDSGWRAEIDGAACPIHRVDVALRGMRVPKGTHAISMIYDPPSVRVGFQIAGAAGAVLVLWTAWLLRHARSTAFRPQSITPRTQSPRAV